MEEEEPPYASSRFDRKIQSVKGRLENNPDGPQPLLSFSGAPPALPERNQVQRSQTLGRPSSSAQIRVDVHAPLSGDHPNRFENGGFEPSTLPSQSKIGHMNPNGDRRGSNHSDEEPQETDPCLPTPGSPGNARTSGDVANTSMTPLMDDRPGKKKKGLFQKLRPKKSQKDVDISKAEKGSGCKSQKPETSANPGPVDAPQNVPDIEPNVAAVSSPNGGATASKTADTENLEDLYAKVDKSKKKKLPKEESKVPGDEQSPNGPILDTKTRLDSPISDEPSPPSEGIGITSLPPLKTKTGTDILSIPRQPSVGVSPTNDIPKGLDTPTVNNNDDEKYNGTLKVELPEQTQNVSGDRLPSASIFSVDASRSVNGGGSVAVMDDKGATEMSSIGK